MTGLGKRGDGGFELRALVHGAHLHADARLTLGNHRLFSQQRAQPLKGGAA